MSSISAKILKSVIHYLSVPLSSIINDSIEQGIFPDVLEQASVTPSFKAGSEKETKNYRPISVLPLLSKVFERCIYCRLVAFLSENNVLSDHQYGFRKGRNTSDALIGVIEYIYKQLNQKKHTVGISLDFSKAFDTVSHDILLRKLFEYGIRKVVHSWFRSYLANRTQRVRLDDCFSEFKLIKSGVPQGSILGPVLFLVYINDLPNVSSTAEFTLFADDATLTVSHHDNVVMTNETNSILSLVHEWTLNNA